MKDTLNKLLGYVKSLLEEASTWQAIIFFLSYAGCKMFADMPTDVAATTSLILAKGVALVCRDSDLTALGNVGKKEDKAE